MRYCHTQKAPLYLILIAVALIMFFSVWMTPQPSVQLPLLIAGVFMTLLAFTFRHLTVSDGGDRLLIRFGPLPLFRRSVRYDDIRRVERARSTLLDGWGIHVSPSGGWTWNLWGFDCVDVYYKEKSKLRIGTDDPAGLEIFLQLQLAQRVQ